MPRSREFPACRAQIGYRAQQARRLSRKAYGRAQFHDGLIEITRTSPIKQFFRGPPQTLACKILPLDALHDALDVSVHDGDWLLESNTGNRRRSVAANPRQSTQIFHTRRKLSPILLHNLFRRSRRPKLSILAPKPVFRWSENGAGISDSGP
jgi:hypothetical protein